jgi:hypothetical protein
MPRIVVTQDGSGFVSAGTRIPFHPWGMNYARPGLLLEDFWEQEWETVAEDFREQKALGANVVRVHLQVAEFMEAPDRPNPDALKQLGRLLALAEDVGLYLDVTGLGAYRPADVPAWYDALDESERWAAQAAFWEAVAEVGSLSPAVFCYDLMNEPISPAAPRLPGAWASGELFSGFDFVQYIALKPEGRNRADIAISWIRRMTAAIRKHDRQALVTVGLLPLPTGFFPNQVAPELDFLSVHIYPESRRPDDAMASLRPFSRGKPVVIEETFPLYSSAAELEDFLRASREIATGWIGHYNGLTLQELEAIELAGSLTVPQQIYLSWLRLFVRLKPEFAPEPTTTQS